MIHRFVGKRQLAAGATLCLMLSASPAFGFCRSTTCALAQHAPECARDANGCWNTGAPLYWAGGCAAYSIQRDGSPKLGLDFNTVESIAISAFARWPAATCPDGFPAISVSEIGAVTCNRLEYHPNGPNANIVMFRDSDWPHDPFAIALTTVTFGATSGKILDADMEINSANNPLDVDSLAYVLTHESGHFFGLDHSPEPDAIMYAQYTLMGPGAPPPMLTPDDVGAICAAYPPTSSMAECSFDIPHGFASDCGGDVTT
jgi:hypothetical protein